MTTGIINAKIYDTSRRRFYEGTVRAGGGVIISVGEDKDSFDRHGCDRVIDAEGRLLIPGLVDVHTHGRAGGDFATADEETLKRIARAYFGAGVTAVMPTLASETFDNWLAAINRIRSVKVQEDEARFIGIHLEGRWLNPVKRGAHSLKLLAPPDAGELEKIAVIAGNPLHITVAPELDENGEFLKKAKELKATVALGHTCADYGQATKALENGANAFSHLFNTMPPLHHRNGGAVCAALTSGAYCELICDGKHVSPEMVRLVYQLKGAERFVLVSDSMEGTGCPDGLYSVGGLDVSLKDGEARTSDGALAGSTLSLYDAVLNLMRFCNISFADALYSATAAPAEMVGIFDKVGSVEAGKAAGIVLVNPGDLSVFRTYNFI